jgi:hypothetical protein
MEGANMTAKKIKPSLSMELIHSVQREIEHYQKKRAEQTGQRIEWQQAAEEWMQVGFPQWKVAQWNGAVKQAMQADATSKPMPPKRNVPPEGGPKSKPQGDPPASGSGSASAGSQEEAHPEPPGSNEFRAARSFRLLPFVNWVLVLPAKHTSHSSQHTTYALS